MLSSIVLSALVQNRDDLLSGQVIGLQEGINSHWSGMPPDRIAYQDHIVVTHIADAGGKFRSGILIQFPSALSTVL